MKSSVTVKIQKGHACAFAGEMPKVPKCAIFGTTSHVARRFNPSGRRNDKTGIASQRKKGINE